MARVVLVMPRLPQRMGAPYLGQQYVAAQLLRRGHAVRVLDPAAPHWVGGDAAVVEACEAFEPDLVGMTVFTWSAARAYALAARLRSVAPRLVCGGPHPTVLPHEPLEHGFDVSVPGEGEHVICELAAAVDAGRAPTGLPGVVTRQGAGPTRPPIEDLDALAWPLESYSAYDMGWYVPGGGAVVPGGLMTSRGCPARCTFCANYVTGRAYRFRSPEGVVAEMAALREHHDVRHFPMWDDAFTALRPRLYALCDALQAHPALRGVTWSAITPGNMVKPRDLARMRRAGCVAINFGLESGDLNTLRIIQKGQRPEHVKAAVAAARAEGMQTIVNFMFGFPGEGVDELSRTRELMETLAPHVDYFNHRGVLVPFPGTAIYDRHHQEYGLEGWWRDASRVPIEPDLHSLSPEALQAHLEHDPTLDQDFFRYSDAVRDLIADCVRFKARHNQSTVERYQAVASRA